MTAEAARILFRKKKKHHYLEATSDGSTAEGDTPSHVRHREQKVISSIFVLPWMEPSSLVKHIIHLKRPKTVCVRVCRKQFKKSYMKDFKSWKKIL